MLTTALTWTLYGALVVFATLIGFSVWRIWRGENVIDRLLGVDLVGTLAIGVLVLIALIEQQSLFIDVALGIAAVGFVGVVALARYAAQQLEEA